MSSTKKTTSLPGFEIDEETGKYVPVPVDFKALFGDRPKRPNQGWSNSKKTNNNDQYSYQPAKFRKSETGVRKELFKMPAKSIQPYNKESTKDTRRSGVRKSLIKCLPTKNGSKESLIKKQESNKTLSLRSITEETEPMAEPKENATTMNHTGYAFKSPMTPRIKFTAKPAQKNEKELKTPDSFESQDDFLKLEQLCQSPMITNESPVSSVCNLFESNMLLNSEKKNVSIPKIGRKEALAELRMVIGRNQEIYQETNVKISEIVKLQTQYEENLGRMLALVNKLENSDEDNKAENDEEKENSSVKRRSLRLRNKSPSSKPLGSPVILKSGDLRKATLSKSLVFKCQKYQVDSPRLQRAMDMYNSAKNGCNALLTPKVSRMPESPFNLRGNLSLKVQQQCLLLQDTPVHK